jgi:hypothetical protein
MFQPSLPSSAYSSFLLLSPHFLFLHILAVLFHFYIKQFFSIIDSLFCSFPYFLRFSPFLLFNCIFINFFLRLYCQSVFRNNLPPLLPHFPHLPLLTVALNLSLPFPDFSSLQFQYFSIKGPGTEMGLSWTPYSWTAHFELGPHIHHCQNHRRSDLGYGDSEHIKQGSQTPYTLSIFAAQILRNYIFYISVHRIYLSPSLST